MAAKMQCLWKEWVLLLYLSFMFTALDSRYGEMDRNLRFLDREPTYCNLVGTYPPAHLVMYCQRYHTTYLYCLLPGQPQVNRAVFGRQLFVSHCFPVGGFLARWRDNSRLEHMTLTRTVVHDVGSLGLARGSSANPGEGRKPCQLWGCLQTDW